MNYNVKITHILLGKKCVFINFIPNNIDVCFYKTAVAFPKSGEKTVSLEELHLALVRKLEAGQEVSVRWSRKLSCYVVDWF